MSNKKKFIFLFFLTGVTGLIYELVWTRMLILAFGSTHFAITTVLTIYMTGLAIGSILFGKVSDLSTVPLKIYGIIELAVGIYCFSTPFVFQTIRDLYVETLSTSSIYTAFNPYQFGLSFCGLIIPTTLMGGSLPAIMRFFTLSESQERVQNELLKSKKKEKPLIGASTGILYAVNTFGAVTGTLLTGMVLLYTLGIEGSLHLAGWVNVLIGGFLLLYNPLTGVIREKGALPSSNTTEKNSGSSPSKTSNRSWLILVCFAFSGFTALAYEVVWSRILSLILGSSIYAFTIILTAFLTGISVGSIFFSKYIKKNSSPLLIFAALEAVIGFSAIGSIFLYNQLPYMFGWIHSNFSENFWIFLTLQFSICLTIMAIPTLAMGATFPVVCELYTNNVNRVGTDIGRIYFFNTLGAILGSFVGGFVLVPIIGIQTSIWAIAAINILLFVLLICITDRSSVFKGTMAVGSVALVALCIYFLPPWDKNVMTLGPYVTPMYLNNEAHPASQKLAKSELTYYKEGLNAVITVRKSGKEVTYQANGKTEARMIGDKPGESWYILGQLPMMLADKIEDTLLIGLGSGITLGAMIEHDVEKVDVIELEPAVVEAAKFFSKATRNATEDPRVEMHITDGRGFLSSQTKNSYDVIISGVSDPWISGVSNLFTKEYFQELYEKLRPDGVTAIWFQNYKMSDEDFKIGINTFASVFPSVSIWFHYSQSADLIVLGTKKKRLFDMSKVEEKMKRNTVQDGLKRINITSPFDFLEFFLIGNNDLKSYLKDSGINTDNLPVLEFSLPKAQYSHDYGSAERIERILSRVEDIIPPIVLPVDEKEKDVLFGKLAEVFARDGFRKAQTTALYKKILQTNPDNKAATDFLDNVDKQ